MAERVSKSRLAMSDNSQALSDARLDRVRDIIMRVGLPLVVFAVFLACWQFLPVLFGIPTYELPNLTSTLSGLQQDWSDIGSALLVSLQDALAGFILGNLFAILGATVFAYSPTMERAFYPLAIVVQTIPILVYAPLFVILFYKIPIFSGAPEAASVVGVAVLISFFPTLVNMTLGLKAIDPPIFELMRLLNASKTQVFVKVRFPSSLPYLFSSLKITSTLAFVGALVGEYMVGGGFNPVGQALSHAGIQSIFGFATAPLNASGVGQQLQTFQSRLDKPGIFADVLAISLLSIGFFGATALAERLFVPWHKTR